MPAATFSIYPFDLAPPDLDANDYFGYSVSISGMPGNSVAIVGAYKDDGVDNSKIDAGAAYTYRDTGAGWTLDTAVLRPFEPDAGDYFGYSVSISGTPGNSVAIVGAYYDDGATNNKMNAGAAYIYNDTGTGWMLDAILRPSELDAWDTFGFSVSISGTPGNSVGIVGAYGDDGVNNTLPDVGVAYIYNDTGTGWMLDAILRPSELDAYDSFGYSVSISGTPGNSVAIVGAYRDDGVDNSLTGAGAAYTYQDTGTGWVLDTILRPAELITYDYFGLSVSVSGTPGISVAIVGAYYDDGATNNQTNAGAAYTYQDTGAGWTLDTIVLRPAELDLSDHSGYSVSVSGTPGNSVAIVGAHRDDGDTNQLFDAGAAYIYNNTGTGWMLDTILRPAELIAYDYFGLSVSVSGTPGNSVGIVGAYGDDGVNNTLSDVGVAYIYSVSNNNNST